jgi:hypothetical protein
MRDATVAALNMAVTLNRPGADPGLAEPIMLAALIASLAEAITTNVIGRQELLTFLVTHSQVLSGGPPVDCSELPAALVTAMQDKVTTLSCKIFVPLLINIIIFV